MSVFGFHDPIFGLLKIFYPNLKKKIECKDMFEEQPSVVLIKTAGNL